MKWHPSTPSAQRRAAGTAIAVVAVACTLAACTTVGGGGTPGAPATSASKKCDSIAFLANNMANPWIATMADGGKAQGSKLGATVKVQDANLNTATQISQIQQAIANKASGIVVQSVEANGIVPAIQKANAAGIPVVAVNSGVGSGANVVTYVGVDQVTYGKGLAQLAEKALPDGGKVAIITGVSGNPVEVDRTKGITDTLAANPKFRVVATVTDSWSNDKNLAAVQDLLNKYPKGQIDAIIAEGPQLYVGAAWAHKNGRDEVKFIAGDYPVQVKSAIASGELYGSVLQDGAQQGAAAVTDLCNWIKGDKSSVKQPTDFVEMPLVTQANVADYKTSWNW